MKKQEHTQAESGIHRIWISQRERIASFHAVDTYELQIVRGQEEYEKTLRLLLEQGFRFQ